jgi:hypothetical protein
VPSARVFVIPSPSEGCSPAAPGVCLSNQPTSTRQVSTDAVVREGEVFGRTAASIHSSAPSSFSMTQWSGVTAMAEPGLPGSCLRAAIPGTLKE